MVAVLVVILVALMGIGLLYVLDHNPWHAKRSTTVKYRGKT
jgi:hypothetical protein